MVWARVNQPEEAIQIDAGDCCRPHSVDTLSPIDVYMRHARHVLTLGSPAELEVSVTLGRLLLLGLVTGVETYFRTLLAGVLRQCPLSQRAAADQMLSYGSVKYYPKLEVEAALFENASFSSSKEIKRMTQKALGIDVASARSLAAAITQYERVCHLRHASVHAHGALTSANAAAIGVTGELAPASVTLEIGGLHAVARVCQSLVRAYNQELYGRVIERWLSAELLSGVWSKDKGKFSRLHSLFASSEDGVSIDAKIAYVPVKAASRARAAPTTNTGEVR
jgi:hypothetical protein